MEQPDDVDMDAIEQDSAVIRQDSTWLDNVVEDQTILNRNIVDQVNDYWPSVACIDDVAGTWIPAYIGPALLSLAYQALDIFRPQACGVISTPQSGKRLSPQRQSHNVVDDTCMYIEEQPDEANEGRSECSEEFSGRDVAAVPCTSMHIEPSDEHFKHEPQNAKLIKCDSCIQWTKGNKVGSFVKWLSVCFRSQGCV